MIDAHNSSLTVIAVAGPGSSKLVSGTGSFLEREKTTGTYFGCQFSHMSPFSGSWVNGVVLFSMLLFCPGVVACPHIGVAAAFASMSPNTLACAVKSW